MSILIFIFIAVLVVSEFWYYRAVETKYDYEVDTEADRWVIPCTYNSLHIFFKKIPKLAVSSHVKNKQRKSHVWLAASHAEFCQSHQSIHLQLVVHTITYFNVHCINRKLQINVDLTVAMKCEGELHFSRIHVDDNNNNNNNCYYYY